MDRLIGKPSSGYGRCSSRPAAPSGSCSFGALFNFEFVFNPLFFNWQNGPRLPDYQPTEGGAGPSPAPPAAPSPRIPPPQVVAGTPLNNSFRHSSSPALGGVRSGSGVGLNLTSPSTTCASPSSAVTPSGPPPLSYVAPSFFGSAGPPRPDSRPSTGEGQSRPSPHQLGPPSARPIYSPAAPGASSSGLAPPPAPPPTYSSSPFPFFPPVSMMRTPPAMSNSSHLSSASFLAPSPPTTSMAKPGSGPLLSYGEQPFPPSRPSQLSLSVAPPSGPNSKAATSPSPSASSRPTSRASSQNSGESSSRPGSLPYPSHSSSSFSMRSPSLPPPQQSTSSAFPNPGDHPSVSKFCAARFCNLAGAQVWLVVVVT